MQRSGVITLTTDFGVSSPYVAQMRGVLLQRMPAARLVDVTHAIEPQNVEAAAVVLEDIVPWFPPGTIHLVVVDPGVGTERRLIAGRLGDGYFIGPDNGLVALAADRYGFDGVVSLDRPEFWLPTVHATFHGRDIMSPVAAALCRGTPLESLGTPITDWQRLGGGAVVSGGGEGRPRGRVVLVDSFGNLVTNLRGDQPSTVAALRVGDQIARRVRTYGDAPPGSLVALLGSSGRWEIAVVNGHAARELGVGAGEVVEVEGAEW